MKILHLDSTHSYLSNELEKLGFTNHFDFKSAKKKIENLIFPYCGIIIRSRIIIDKSLIDKAVNLKFIARFGSGLENIDLDYANTKNIKIISDNESSYIRDSPEWIRDLIILSKCRFSTGHEASTFSFLPSFLGDSEFIPIK